MAAPEAIEVEVVYARPDQQVLLRLALPSGSTVGEAIRQSGLLERFPEIDLARDGVGIFSQRAQLGDVLHPGDRVELYRPLAVDPKQARRQRAAAKPRPGSLPTSAR